MSTAVELSGRELDAAIAVALFGWRWLAVWTPIAANTREEHGVLVPPYGSLRYPDDRGRLLGATLGYVPRARHWDLVLDDAAFGVTTWDLMGAVVEAMFTKGFEWTASAGVLDATAAFHMWDPVTRDSVISHDVTADTLPQATALAALDALRGGLDAREQKP